MAQYDMTREDFESNEDLFGENSNVSKSTQESVNQLFADQENVVVSDYDPADPPSDADVVVVPEGTEVDEDPGGSVVIFQGQASGTFQADSEGRSFIAQGNDDQNLDFTGEGEVTVETGSGSDQITAESGVNLTAIPGDGDNTVEGGDGFDQVIVDNDRGDYDIDVDEDGNLIITGSSYEVSDVETIQFQDGLSVVAEDEDQAIVGRMYQVLFDREPDEEGLNYWFDTLESESFDDGTYDMWDVTHAFMNSDEFVEEYSGLDNEEFLTNLYLGMDDREPDQEGMDYWMDVLENPEEHIDSDVWKGEDDNAQVHVVYAFAYSDEAEKVMGLEGSKYIIPTYDDDDAS